jgi:hypothetical protein
MLEWSFIKRAGGVFLLLGLICCIPACNNTSPNQPAASVQPTLSSIQTNIFSLKCGVAGCHVTGGIAPMSLESGKAFNSLVNATSNYGNPRLMRVKPYDALNSVLYLKVIGDPQVGGPQARMPGGLGQMTTTEINAIRDWINAGALLDGTSAPVNSVRIIMPASRTVQVGGTLDLDAQALDANNNVTAAVFKWSSSTPNVATVDSTNGIVTGVSLGVATIMATASSISDTLSVTVVPAQGLQATLSSIQTNIFTPKCAVPGCHVTGGGAPMSLAAGVARANLVGVNSAYGRLRVASGDANNSVLYLKVTGANGVGGRMPPAAPLSQAETDSIKAWINAGAQNN